MKGLKAIIPSLKMCGLLTIIIAVGVLMHPVNVKAATITAQEITDNSIGTYDTQINISAKMTVENQSTASNGTTAYIPEFHAYIVAKPLTSGDFFPYDYKTSHPGGKWIIGKYNLAASSSVTFGDDYIYTISTTDFGYDSTWFSGAANGEYRYQIFLYDDASNPFGTMFTLPDMDTANNRLFLDFYVQNGAVIAVVLVDEANNKLSNNETQVTSTTAAPSIGRLTDGIIYNVLDVTVSNKIIGSSRTSPFHYLATVVDNGLTGGPIAFDLGTQTNATAVYNTPDPKKFTIDEKYGSFEYVIKNYPIGWGITVEQTSPPHTATKLEVWTAAAPQYDGGLNVDQWKASPPSGYTESTTSTPTHTISSVANTDSGKNICFVNLAIIELPPTGIALDVLPFIILAALAGLLLVLIMKRRNNEG